MNAPQPMTLKKPAAPNVPGSATGAVNRARWLRNALPAISLVVLLVTIFITFLALRVQARMETDRG